ncbi:MAG: ATP-binding protein [Eubacteriales bacterium]|nr:ATP-binding protein [Eubacteriales bacterium]
MGWIWAVALLLVCNVLCWYFFTRRYMGKRVARFEQELVNRHYVEVETMYRKMRGWRHDYHNHIQALKVCLSQQEYGQMKEFLDQVDVSLSEVDRVVKTGNVMLDAIVNSKIALMKEKGIAVDCTAYVPAQMAVKAIDLCVLLGNLLDNALEACQKMGKEEDRFIRIYMDVIKGQLYLCITNSMEGKARAKGGVYLSDKAGAHGFGMESIDRIVKQYGGYIRRGSEEGVFAAEVMLPLGEASG